MKRLVLLVAALVAAPAFGEVVHLKDGSTVTGSLRKTDDGWVVTEASGKQTTVTSDRVDRIEIQRATGDDASAERLRSLRRAVEKVADIKQILDRYQTFLAQNAGTPAAADAEADVAQWKDRQRQGLVKVGDKWVSPAERTAIIGQTGQMADAVRTMLNDGRLKDAGAMIDRGLSVDPQNVSLLYLKGVLLFRQDQLALAKKAFEAVLVGAADHAPTLNDLAVVTWKLNGRLTALGSYDHALTAAPDGREILDNIAEALNALKPDEKKSTIAVKLASHFAEQDAALQKKLAAKDLHRWGSSWVSGAELAKLQEAQNKVQAQLDQMSSDYDADTARIQRIDQMMRDDQQEMRNIENTSYLSPDGRTIVQMPYPARYFDIGREISAITNERAQRTADQERLRRQVKQVQQGLPTPQFTGVQKIIEADGMPVIAPPPPAPIDPLIDPFADAPPKAATPPAAPNTPATPPVQ